MAVPTVVRNVGNTAADAAVRHNAAATTTTVDRPATVNTGDLIVIHASYRNNSLLGPGTLSNLPSGFTVHLNHSVASVASSNVIMTKVATASEPGPTSAYTWTTTNSMIQSVHCFKLTAGTYDTTTPVDVVSAANGAASGTTATGLGVTTTMADTLLMLFVASAISTTPSSALTLQYAVGTGTGTT